MSEVIQVNIGDFVVIKERYFISVHKVTKVSEQCFWYAPEYRGEIGRPTRQSRAYIVFSGPKEIADRLADQLVSSRNQLSNEERAVRDRREARDQEIIAAAKAVQS